MDVVSQINGTAVVVIYTARRARAPIGVAGAAAVAIPGNVDEQIILAAIFEILIESEAEPATRGPVKLIGATFEYLDRRVTAEVGSEVGYELGDAGVTQLNGEVVIRAGVARIAAPLPFLDGTAGNSVRA